MPDDHPANARPPMVIHAAWNALAEEYKKSPSDFEKNPVLMAEWRKQCIGLGKPATFRPYLTDEEKEAIASQAQAEAEKASAAKIQADQDKLSEAKKFLADDTTKPRAFSILSQLVLRDDLHPPISASANALFNSQNDKAFQLWLLGQAEPIVGNYWDEKYKALELWWISHAYEAMKEEKKAQDTLDEAFRVIGNFTKTEAAVGVSAQIAGWLWYYKKDEQAKRAIKLCEATLSAAKDHDPFTYIYIASLAYLMNDKTSAEHYMTLANAHPGGAFVSVDGAYVRSSPIIFNTRFHARCREFDKAWESANKYRHPLSLSMLAVTAAAERREDDYLKAKTFVLQNKPSNYEVAYVIWADALMGDFESANQRAKSMDDKDIWKRYAYCLLTREYAILQDDENADLAWRAARLYGPAVSAGFYLGKAMFRNGHTMVDLYKHVCEVGTDCGRIAEITGIVAGLNQDVPHQELRPIPYW